MTGRLYYNRHRKKWQCIVECGKDADGRRKQIFRDARTKAEARQILQKLLHDLEDGTHVEPHNLTVAEYLRSHHADHARHHASPRTHECNGYLVEAHLVPGLGAHKLTELRPAHLQSYYSAKLDRGLSPTTVRKHHNVLHAALRHAVRLQLLAVNPADSVVPPRIVHKEMRFLDAGQSAAMLRAAAGTRLYMPLLLALGTGMRRGELLGLRWSDVDLDGGTLIVTQTVQEAFGQLHIKEPKTAKSQRRITLPALVVDALRAYRTEQAKETLARAPRSAESDLVLTSPDGGPWWPSYFNRTWQRFKKRQGLAVRFHDLRHTHATQLLKAGVHPKVVSERLGHASIGITLDTYSHVMPGMQEEAAEKIDAGLRKALAG